MKINKNSTVIIVGQNTKNYVEKDSVEETINEFTSGLSSLLGVKKHSFFDKASKKIAGFAEEQSGVGKKFTSKTFTDLYNSIQEDFNTQYLPIETTDVKATIEDYLTLNSLDELQNDVSGKKLEENSHIHFKSEDESINGTLEIKIPYSKKEDINDKTGIDSLKNVGIGIGATIVVPPAGVAIIYNSMRVGLDKAFKPETFYSLHITPAKDLEGKEAERFSKFIDVLAEKYQ